jgi:hypothetical protein
MLIQLHRQLKFCQPNEKAALQASLEYLCDNMLFVQGYPANPEKSPWWWKGSDVDGRAMLLLLQVRTVRREKIIFIF